MTITMNTTAATASVKKATVSAVVIRADGAREDLGVIASTEGGSLTFAHRVAQAFRDGWRAGTKKAGHA